MHTVTLTPSGLLALGTDLWISADGLTWHLVDDRNGGNEVAVGGPGLVAVGDDDDVAAVWVADLGG